MVQSNPTNFQAAILLASAQRSLKQDQQAIQTLDQVVNSPNATPDAILGAAAEYNSLHDLTKLEGSLEKLVKVAPDSPEAWYDLAALKASLGKTNDIMPNLKKAVELSSKRRQQNPQAADLLARAKTDDRFASIRSSPDFARLGQ